MNDARQDKLHKVLAFASVVEIAGGLALLIDPRLVLTLFVGSATPVEEIPMGRLTGIAIFALGLACWPSGHHAPSGSPALRGMLVYNVLIAAFLVYLFAIGHLGGVLLWPAVVLHAVVASFLIWTGRRMRQSKVGIQ